jgi:pimeloyl-ACP methyl ester carboxylesterase
MDNVRDLDRLRQAVGDPKLSYVGLSYGTVIGAVYANVFPDRYRALVLHGLVDSVSWFEPSFAYPIDRAVQRQKALNAALQACDAAGQSVCAFAPDAPQKYARLLATIRAQADASQNSEDFSALWEMSSSFLNPGFSAHYSAEELQDVYEELVVDHAASSPELIAEAHKPVPLDTSGTVRLSAAVFAATSCSDAGRIPQTFDAWIDATHRADQAAPVFGAASVLDRAACASWSAFGDRYTGPWNRGRAPILLLNQQWDPATPLAWAQTMTRELGRAHLITISGWGHTIETPCSTRAVDSYLLTGRPPATSFCGDGLGLFTERGALDLQISAPSRSLSAGESTTLTLRVTSDEDIDLRHVRTCLLLPAGLVYQRSQPSATLTHGSRCWSTAALAAGQAKAYTLTARALRGASGNRTALATTTATDAAVTHGRLTLSIAAPPPFTG